MSVDVSQQYKTSSNLKARANLHRRYATTSWFAWSGERMGFREGCAVADIGCGAGWFWTANQHQLPDGMEVSLVDQSEQMVAEAKAALSELSAVKQVAGYVKQAEALPFEDASFDVVMAMHMVYHLTDPDQALDEMRRILKPGGRLVISLNSAANLKQVYELNSRVFDVAPMDPSVVMAPPEEVEARLARRFRSVSKLTYQDTYAIDDVETVFATLTSYPPGNEATDAQREQLRAEITKRLASTTALCLHPMRYLC